MAHRATATAATAEDLVSVGTRVSWGAIFAGGLLALAIHFLLSLLGTAVGVSVSDRVEPDKLQTGALIWVVVTTCTALFVGGMVTSLFTVGENKVEAVLYGIIMWALLIAILVGLGAAGLRAGFSAMVSSSRNWETALEQSAISKEKIENAAKEAQTSPTKEAVVEATKRITWYTFGGTWISMFAAAAGAWVGAGPTFRLVRVA